MSLDNIDLTLVNSMEEVGNLLRWLGEGRPYHALGLDLETTGLDTFNDRIRLAQVGDHRRGWAIPWDQWNGVIHDIVSRWDGDYILHNAPFDLHFLDRSGIVVPRSRVHDTMIQSKIREPNMSATLKNQSSRHVDAAAAGLQTTLQGTAWTWETVPIDYEPYWLYGALDPVLTYMLHDFHYPKVMAESPRAYEIEMAVLWIADGMRRYGTHVDGEWVNEKYAKFTEYCGDVERWCRDEYNVSPGSNQAIINILTSEGASFEKKTKSGALALDKDVLEGIDHPLAKAVYGRRQAQKMTSTYLKFYRERADSDGLIHPSFNTLGAKTSRMSCSDPNLQNLPRLGTSVFGDVVRNCINTRWGRPWDSFDEHLTALERATHPESGALIMCDYSQIEMRILAHFANDPTMIDAFTGGGDFFVNLARQLFHDETINKKDPRRQITKNAGYATIYGSGVRKFSQTAGIPESQGREFMARWNNLYPGVKAFQTGIINDAVSLYQEHGIAFTHSPLTGRRFIAEPSKEYALVNYLIQGVAAEINKIKLIELDAAGVGQWMMATIHDEVILDVPGDHVSEVVGVLLDVMNDNDMLRVPILAEASFGERWGRKNGWE